MTDLPSRNSLEKTTDTTPSVADDANRPIDALGQALFERLGVGGMGEVYRCGDDALQRDLAIKILKLDFQGDAAAEARFLREARLTGSLQHPGIVPVHQLGHLADGRPCYTMKLVRGRTFADLLRDEPQGPERLSRLLAVLEKVCQAVAFAHSKGVIHRDLKPSNIMVGEFGEVQVMDWGLAKELSRSEPVTVDEATDSVEPVARTDEGETPNRTNPFAIPEPVETGAWAKEGESLSRSGAVMGTPAYMPPEQAAGDWDIVDERADVFALGAILCELLTGRPPYHGAASREDLLRRARRGDVAQSLRQLEKCGADAVLMELCRVCLAAERLARPRHAGVVAERVAAYQAEVQERLRRAEVERAEAQVQAREERKRRRLTLALAAAVLLLLASGGGFSWWRQRQQDRADLAVSNALAQAEVLAGQARADPLQIDKYQQALEVARGASQLAQTASADSRHKAESLSDRLQQEEQAARKDRELLAALLDVRRPREGPNYQSGAKETLAEPTADEQFASAFRRWGLDVEATSLADATALLHARPRAVVTEVSAALDEWASERRRQSKAKEEWQHLANLAALLDDAPGSKRRELREILARDRLPLERALSVLSAALRPVPIPVEVPLGPDRTRLRQLAEQSAATREPILGLLTLVQALVVAGEEARAEQLLRAAIVARPREVVLHDTLGELLVSTQPPRWAEAAACFGAARTLRPDLGVNLATALRNSGRDQEGLALLEQLVQETPTNPYLHFQWAYALMGKEQLDKAEDEFRQAIALDSRLATAHNGVGAVLNAKGQLDEAAAEFRQAVALDPKLATAHSNLGKILHDKGQLNESEAECRQAIALDPKLATAHSNLGNALYAKGQLDEALAECRQAIALNPKLATAHNGIGAVLNAKGLLDEAAAKFRQAIALDPKLAPAHNNLGKILHDKGQLEEALDEYRQAIALNPKYATARSNLGKILHDMGQLEEALDECRQAIALDPKNAPAHNNLGIALKDKGQLDEAVAEYRQAIALDSKLATAYYNLGIALKDKGLLDEALAELRQAIALGPKDAKSHYCLGLALHDKGQLNEALDEYRLAIRLKPDLAESHCNLGHVLQQQGRFDEALASLRRGHDLGSKQPGWRYPSAQWLRDAERLLVLDKQLPAILSGEERPANPGEAVTLAWMCQQPYQKRYAASARLYGDAFAVEPKLAADLNEQYRYNAACSAALAAAGQGDDARPRPEKVVAMFRRWTLRWLRDDLTAYAKLAEPNNPAVHKTIQERMAQWRSDPDLASVRDPQALDRLPDNERAAWQALWRDVDELAKRVATKAN